MSPRKSVSEASARWFGIAIALLCVVPSACRHKHDEKNTSAAVAKHEKSPQSKSTARETDPGSADLSKQIEAFTGAHTRLVWNECQNSKVADPMSVFDDQLLQGIDTADGRGLRSILKERGNYSRPLLSPDGSSIIYTQKVIKSKGRRNLFQLTIYRTDWQGSKPVKIGDGYAVDMWRDPDTKRDWVIAVQDPEPSKQKTFDADKLVRFPLDGRGKSEVLWDQTSLSPDNIQFSRDGRRACALLPWPAGGVIDFRGKSPSAKEYSHGCWPSQSPDNSYVSWVFNGDHKSASFFNEDGSKSWEVRFNTVPQFHRGEVYHPRWSNHPRFFVLTGPYRGINGGGGRGANVHLCRLSEKLDKLEDVLQVVDNKLSQGFPAAWIEGGEKVDTPGFHNASKGDALSGNPSAVWPSNPSGLVFLWKDRPSLNSFKGPDGRTHTAQVETQGLAHNGRNQEVVLEGGVLQATEESSAFAVSALNKSALASFEAVVLPSALDAGARTFGQLLSSPSLIVGVREGKLVVSLGTTAWECTAPLPDKPFHLAVAVSSAKASAWINGQAQVLQSAASVPKAVTEGLEFGVDWNGGLLHLALYDRMIDDAEATTNADLARTMMAKFPPPPVRVSLVGKLVETSGVPSAESIAPYRSSLVACVYEVQKVTAGSLTTQKVLVKHWGLLNLVPTAEFPREVGKTYELTIERETDHPELKGERVSDDTTAFDLEPWLDVGKPSMKK